MPLCPATKTGPYEVIAPLGAGGMGEVHRARDESLGRDVAIKALPEAFAQDPERLARFEREAEPLATLNHPNIGPRPAPTASCAIDTTSRRTASDS
jgi:serine/threonine protein kinase